MLADEEVWRAALKWALTKSELGIEEELNTRC